MHGGAGRWRCGQEVDGVNAAEAAKVDGGRVGRTHGVSIASAIVTIYI